MKKLLLSLMIIVTLSCKKDAEPAMLLPAIQKIREAAIKKWEVDSKTLLSVDIPISQKIKEEFKNYETDSTIAVTVRVRLKDKKEEVLLPYAEPFLGGTKYYFYTLTAAKPKLFFHNTAIEDFNASGTSSALPLESVTIVYEKMDIK